MKGDMIRQRYKVEMIDNHQSTQTVSLSMSKYTHGDNVGERVGDCGMWDKEGKGEKRFVLNK